MNDDGTAVLGKKAVATGDDCADPIARGVFSTPTKESTAQYNYTFYGWATTPNGAADSNWNKAVTEDRTVYANFASVVRYYTITYYDSDGTTVLHTESVAYGSVPSYEPVKDGFMFDSWNPVPSAVTGNTSYTAQWTEGITFAGGQWADIVRICDSGNAQKYFALGDTREFSFTDPNGNPASATLQIIGFNVDTLAGGTEKAAISVIAYPASFKMKLVSEQGGNYLWSTCVGRSLLNGTVLSSFPDDLREGIKNVTKVTRKYVDAVNVTGIETTTDKLWIPSAGEMGVAVSDKNNVYPESVAEGRVSYSGLKLSSLINNTVSGAGVWLRTGNTKYPASTLRYTTMVAGFGSSYEAGVAFGFCI
jgi:hypothetical protein